MYFLNMSVEFWKLTVRFHKRFLWGGVKDMSKIYCVHWLGASVNLSFNEGWVL